MLARSLVLAISLTSTFDSVLQASITSGIVYLIGCAWISQVFIELHHTGLKMGSRGRRELMRPTKAYIPGPQLVSVAQMPNTYLCRLHRVIFY